ncbi:hypothetical protein ALC152_15750 [Arcobacter sp. 15-2]|uniref:hypothetical protein n=1 Tax=Arcobacter sp. 15-2 TaxID=3374109 RepID=UPI00399CE2E2
MKKYLNTNTKFIALALLVVLTISSMLYIQTLKETVHQNYKNYEKTANEITIIKQLKEYYGDKKSNKRKIYNILNNYKSKTVSKKEDKASIEFTISKLNYKELDSLNSELLSSGVKVVKLSVKRVDAHTGELFCKVMF